MHWNDHCVYELYLCHLCERSLKPVFILRRLNEHAWFFFFDKRQHRCTHLPTWQVWICRPLQPHSNSLGLKVKLKLQTYVLCRTLVLCCPLRKKSETKKEEICVLNKPPNLLLRLSCGTLNSRETWLHMSLLVQSDAVWSLLNTLSSHECLYFVSATVQHRHVPQSAEKFPIFLQAPFFFRLIIKFLQNI